MHDEVFGDDLLIVTTNSSRGISRRVATLLVLGAIAAAISLLAIFSPETTPRQTLVLLLLGDVLALGMGLALVAASSRGTWTLDKRGIEHRRPIRQSVSLAWSDVSRILWYPQHIELEGKAVRIRVRLNLLAKHESDQVRAWIESRLQGHFDLQSPPPSAWRTREENVRVYASRIVVGLVMATVFAGVLLAISNYPFRSESSRAFAAIAWTFFGSIGCPAPLAFLIGMQNANIDPNYPWRVRRFPGTGKPKLPSLDRDLV